MNMVTFFFKAVHPVNEKKNRNSCRYFRQYDHAINKISLEALVV